MKIAVLMSTFNGEKFLEQQLGSLLSQQECWIDLYVRDDGSTDNTLSILKSIKFNKLIRNIYVEKNIGYSKSFLRLIELIPDYYDYYAFSDQDDIWLPNKLFKAVNSLTYSNSSLYISSLTFVSEDLKFIKLKIFPEKINFYSVFSRNSFAGCTMVFTNSFFQLLRKHSKTDYITYDNLVLLLAKWFNINVIYDKSSFILHRIHNYNVTYKKSSLFKIIRNQFYHTVNSYKTRIIIANFFLNLNHGEVLNEKSTYLCDYLNYKKRFSNHIKFLVSKKFLTNNFVIDIFNFLLIVFKTF